MPRSANRDALSCSVSLAISVAYACTSAPTELIDAGVSAGAMAEAADAQVDSRADGAVLPGAALSLVNAERWTSLDLSDDPFASWTNETVNCSPIAGFYPEGSALEVDTSRCNFVTLFQPLTTVLPQGARIEVEIVHFDLTAEIPTDARLAIHLGPADSKFPNWQTTIAIPGAANLIVEQFTLASSLEEGAGVLFHLQNHGQNTWRLERVDWLQEQ